MNSKQKPLWLVFENGDETKGAKQMYAMYKSGDDCGKIKLHYSYCDLWTGCG